MKAKTFIGITIAAVAAFYGLTFVQCSQPVGSLSHQDINAALSSRTLSISHSATTWLQDSSDTLQLSAVDSKRVVTGLRSGRPKTRNDGFYKDLDDRGRKGENVYYLVPSNGQTLVIRVKGQKVSSDDMELTEQAQAELYNTLAPYLSKLGPPQGGL